MNEILKPGKYFLGDPSYVLPSKIYNGIWKDVHNFEIGKIYINDTDFCVYYTHYGDGIYYDTRKRKYNVDCGVIGLVDISLIEDISLCNGIGYIFDFKEEIHFYYDNGIFIIKSGKKYIKIDTRIEEEYNSDEDENITSTLFNDSDDDYIDDENDKYFEDECENENIEENKTNNSTFNFFRK